VRSRTRSKTRGGSMPSTAGKGAKQSRRRRPHSRELFSERARCWTSANSNGWAIPRAVYEVEIKGRLRVRIHRGILYVYSPIFPTFAAAGKSRRRRHFVRALRGGRAAQRLASAGLLCHLSFYCNEHGCVAKPLESHAT
jgi:hypothetical protein